MAERNYRTYDKYLEEHLTQHPEEVDDFLQAALEVYEEEQDQVALLLALRHVVKAKGGMTELAKKTGIARENLYRMLAPTGNPTIKTLQSILNAFGYALSFKSMTMSTAQR